VLHAERLPGETVLLVLDAPGIALDAQPGQFVMVRCGDLLLRRPLSIHAADGGKIALLFRVTGSGTGLLSGTEVGGEVQLTGPLGNGYSLPDSDGRVVLIAGGHGHRAAVLPRSAIAGTPAGDRRVRSALPG
jgi:dihydroorotate dehydrogenase electron transfer subunit